MKFSIYLKSGQVITGVSQEFVNQIKNSSLSYEIRHLTGNIQWFTNNKGNLDFMFDVMQIAAIYPEEEKK